MVQKLPPEELQRFLRKNPGAKIPGAIDGDAVWRDIQAGYLNSAFSAATKDDVFSGKAFLTRLNNPKAANTYFNNKSVLLEFWGVCENQTEVALYKLKDWGHLWPGRYFTANLPEDNPLRDFDAAEIIWDFFKTHRRRP